jgi:hypothetical protein
MKVSLYPSFAAQAYLFVFICASNVRFCNSADINARCMSVIDR